MKLRTITVKMSGIPDDLSDPKVIGLAFQALAIQAWNTNADTMTIKFNY